jgi:hypothetical protein
MNPLVMLGLGVGAFLFFKNKAANPTPAYPDSGPYFQGFAGQINSFTQAYSDGAISLGQWQSAMKSFKDQITAGRAAGQLTDNDVTVLTNAIGL